jgi:hypothetical protein
VSKGRLFYGSVTFEVDDAATANEAIAAALDGNTLFVDIKTSDGVLRVFLGSGVGGVGVAVLSITEG